MRRQINDAVTERFGGERAVIGEMERRIPSFYENYRREVEAAAQRQKLAFAQAQQYQSAQAAQSFQQSQAQNAALFAQMQQDAQSRGTTVDPSLQQTALQAAQARQANAQQFGNLLAGQGANFDALFANTGIVAAGQQLQAQEGEANRRRSLERDIGVFRRQERGRIAEAEQKRRLEAELFNLRAEDTRQDNARADRALTRQERADRRSARIERERLRNERAAARREAQKEARLNRMSDAEFRARYGISPEEALSGATPTRGTGRGGSDRPSQFTPEQRREGRQKFRAAVGLIRNTPAARRHIRPGGGRFLRSELVKEGYDPLIARAAAEQAIYGGVWASTARQLRREYGFNPQSIYRPNRGRNAPGPGRSGNRPT